MSLKSNELYEFGDFRLDVGDRRLMKIDGSLNATLPDKSFQTLVTLVRNRGRLISKNELFEAVWPDTFVEENNLDKAIHSIRQALGEKAGEHKYIETIRRFGYRFVAEVREIEPTNRKQPEIDERAKDVAAAGIVTASGGDTESGPAPKVPIIELEPAKADSGADPQLAEREPAALRKNRAHLPLAMIAGTIVLAALGIWYFFIGPKRANAPGVSPDSDAVSEAMESRRSRAYDLYVRGKVRVASENREDTEAAIKLLEEAVAIDPNYAEAYAQLARGYNTMAFKYNSDAERKRFHENAEVAIEKAFALNPDLAEAHFARGLILWTNTRGFPHENAIQSYKRSLALEENSDETHHQLTLVYSHIGLLDEAERSINRAIEINPNNTLARFRRGVNMAYQGKFEEALAVYKTIPSDFTPLLIERSLAEALIQTGRTAEAESIVENYLQRFPQDEGGSFNSVRALLLAKAGKHTEAQDAIDRAIAIGRDFGHFHHTAYNVASAYAAMGKPDEAVTWLETAADGGFPNHPYFVVDPNLESIRTHGGFVDFMSKLKTRWQRFKAVG